MSTPDGLGPLSGKCFQKHPRNLLLRAFRDLYVITDRGSLLLESCFVYQKDPL